MAASFVLQPAAKVKTVELIAARLSCTLANLSREQSYTEAVRRRQAGERACAAAVESKIKNFKTDSKPHYFLAKKGIFQDGQAK
jgi:hypothetical protein